MKPFIREDIAVLKAYEAQTVDGNVRMDANENPFPWPEGMHEELYNYKFSFNRYPDGAARKLREAIANYNRVKENEVLAGNGSDELIQLVLNTFGGRGRAVLIHPPTFTMYAASALITGTAVVEVPLLDGFRLDTEGIMKKASEEDRVKVIILCNPNNPTGSLFPREEILCIVRNTKALVAVDEAYYEFSGETLLDQINNYPNLMIMRTFSKAFGMAALRLGYVIGNSELIADLNKVRQPYNVNSFSQQAGIIALKYVEAYQAQIAIVQKEIQFLYQELGKLPDVTVLPTGANFLLLSSPKAEFLAEKLSLGGFSARYFGELPFLGKSLRFSSGMPEENRAFLKLFKDLTENR